MNEQEEQVIFNSTATYTSGKKNEKFWNDVEEALDSDIYKIMDNEGRIFEIISDSLVQQILFFEDTKEEFEDIPEVKEDNNSFKKYFEDEFNPVSEDSDSKKEREDKEFIVTLINDIIKIMLIDIKKVSLNYSLPTINNMKILLMLNQLKKDYS